jgi:hypothetical protein
MILAGVGSRCASPRLSLHTHLSPSQLCAVHSKNTHKHTTVPSIQWGLSHGDTPCHQHLPQCLQCSPHSDQTICGLVTRLLPLSVFVGWSLLREVAREVAASIEPDICDFCALFCMCCVLFFFFFSVLGFELRALHLLGRHYTT